MLSWRQMPDGRGKTLDWRGIGGLHQQLNKGVPRRTIGGNQDVRQKVERA